MQLSRANSSRLSVCHPEVGEYPVLNEWRQLNECDQLKCTYSSPGIMSESSHVLRDLDVDYWTWTVGIRTWT